MKAVTLPQLVLSGVAAPYENSAPFFFFFTREDIKNAIL